MKDLQPVGGELSAEETVDQIYLETTVQQVQNFTAEELQSVQRIPSSVMMEIFCDGNLVLPLDILVCSRRHHT